MITVTVRRHPFDDETRVFSEAPGQSLADIIGTMMERVDFEVAVALPQLRVAVGGAVFPVEWWKRVRPRVGAIVDVVLAPQGGTFKQLLLTVAVIAITVAAPYVGPAIGGVFAAGLGASVAAAAFTAVATIAVNLAFNALFPPPTQRDRDEPDTAFQIGGARNRAEPNGVVPVVLGFVRASPRYMGNPSTFVVGGDQHVQMAFCHGHAGVDLSEHRFGETPIDDYEEISVEHIDNYTGGGNRLYSRDVNQEDLSITLNDGGEQLTATRFTTEDATAVTLDFLAPRGLFSLGTKSGDFSPRNVRINVDYRLNGVGAWVEAREDFLRGEGENPVFRGVGFALPAPGRYEIRVTRAVSPTSDKRNYFDDLTWTALKSFTGEAPFQPEQPICATFMQVRASEQLTGVIDTYNAMMKSRAKAWSGAAWVDDQPTNNPADLFRLVLQSPANRRAVTDAELDLPTLQRWADYCAAEGWTFNQYRDFAGSVGDTLKDIAAAGRARPITIDGRRSVIFDEDSSPIVQHFTPDNVLDLVSERSYPDLIHAIRVRFFDQDNDFAEDVMTVYADGFNVGNALPANIIELQLPGVTDRDNVYRLARFYIAEVELRPERYTFTTDAEALAARVGDRVRLTHDVTLHGLSSGRIAAIDGNAITVDQAVTVAPGVAYGIRVRSTSDGGLYLVPVTAEAGERLVINATAVPPEISVGDLFAFGEFDRDSAVMRVKEIRWRANYRAEVTLVDDAPEIYEAANGAIPDFDPNITDPLTSPKRFAPENVTAAESLVLEGVTLRSRTRIAWQPVPLSGVGGYLISKEFPDGRFRIIGQVGPDVRVFDVFSDEVGDANFRVEGFMSVGREVTGYTQIGVNLTLLEEPPGDVTGISLGAVDGVATLRWDAVEGVAVSHYEVRRANLGSTRWEDAGVVFERVEGRQISFPIQPGAYLVRALTYRNVKSVTSAIAITTGVVEAYRNVAAEISSGPDWIGTRTDTVTHGGILTLDDVAPFSSSAVATSPVVSRLKVAEGYFQPDATIALGSVMASLVVPELEFFAAGPAFDFAGSEVANSPVVRETDAVGVDFEVSTREDGGPWSDWRPVGEGEQPVEDIRYRLRLWSDDETLWPVVSRAALVVDMPDRVTSGAEVSAVGGFVVNFSGGPFQVAPFFDCTVHDGVAGDVVIVSELTAASVRVTVQNGGADVVRTFHYIARGYGREVTEA